MLPSWQLALNFLSGRPGRTALILSAVASAAALVVAISCAISTLQGAMEHGLRRALGGADARVIHQFNGRFNESLLEEMQQWPEVRHAAARLVNSISITHADNRQLTAAGRNVFHTPTAVGIDFDAETQLSPIDLLSGRMPQQPTEILIDPLAQEEMQAEVGDVMRVDRAGATIELTIVGVYERQRLITMLQQPQIRIDRQMLAETVYQRGQISSIMLMVHEGVDVQAFCDAYQDRMPRALSLEPAEMVRAGFDRRIQSSRFAVIVASMLTFMSAAFIAVTAMTTSVTERQREMAMVRSIGATRSQLFSSQLIVGLVLGVLGALIGIPLGIMLASGIAWWYQEEMQIGLVLNANGIMLAGGGALLAGFAGAMYPAWLASTVSPLQAMARQARPIRALPIIICTAIGLALIGAQLGLLAMDDVDAKFFAYIFVGLPLVHLGYFMLAVVLMMAMAIVACAVISFILRLPRGMLRNSVLATPFRNGFTAGALMVGISLLVSTWAGGQALLHDWVGTITVADGFAFRRAGITPEQQQAIAQLPFVQDSCAIGYLPVRIVDRQVFGVRGISPANVTCIGFDPDIFFDMNAVTWLQGEEQHAISRLKDGDAIIVAERFLVARNIGVGDTLVLGAGQLEQEFEIVGVVGAAGLDLATQFFGVRSAYMEYAVSSVFMDRRAVQEHFDNDDVLLMQLNVSDDIDDEQAAQAIAEVAPGVRFRSGRWIMAMINRVAMMVLSVQSAIAFAALILACVGVGNVIAANIQARRFEYGVLRAVGGHRSLLMRLILGEAVVLALGGALTGTLLGMHLAWVSTTFYRELAGIEITVSLPLAPTIIGWCVLVIMTLAAALPAAIGLIRRRPSQLLAARRNG